jgi:syntaxin 8
MLIGRPKVVTSIPSPSASPDPFRDDQTPPCISLEPPTPIDRNAQTRGDSFLSNQSTTPFRDDPEDNPRITDSELLTSQQTLMDDQDERLNHLSTSIGRQNQLSMQIGDELDVHHQLLEDTDGAMDATAARLGRARKRLDKVADEAKQYGEWFPCAWRSPLLTVRLHYHNCRLDLHIADLDHRLQDIAFAEGHKMV